MVTRANFKTLDKRKAALKGLPLKAVEGKNKRGGNRRSQEALDKERTILTNKITINAAGARGNKRH